MDLCDLWCQVQKYQGEECSQCPDVYRMDPEQLQLCDLWEELEQLQSSPEPPTTAASEGRPVDCVHDDNPTSSSPLCELWCEVQSYKNASCIECPDQYLNDPESDLLCDLYSELKMKEYDLQQDDSLIPSDSAKNITCLYRDHATSSEPLCQVWCEIQALAGQQCVSCPDQFTQDSHSDELCELWAQIVEAESLEEDSSTTISPPQHVACPYETLADTSPALCQLWCDLESRHGNDCCPAKYIGDPEESLLCQLHHDLDEH